MMSTPGTRETLEEELPGIERALSAVAEGGIKIYQSYFHGCAHVQSCQLQNCVRWIDATGSWNGEYAELVFSHLSPAGMKEV